MKTGKLSQMQGGWYIGDFTPSLLRSDHVEVAIKRYLKGFEDVPHYHRLAKESTAIISGRVTINGQEFGPDDVILAEPGEVFHFITLEDTVTVVVKIPSAKGDKILV